jgi:hypothetical protein
MRTLMKISMPVEPANKAIQDGSLPKLLQSVMTTLRAESSYFYAENGRRTALLVFDLKEPSQIPSIVEPLFIGLNASVDMFPAMNAEDMKTGVEKAMRNAGHVLVGA